MPKQESGRRPADETQDNFINRILSPPYSDMGRGRRAQTLAFVPVPVSARRLELARCGVSGQQLHNRHSGQYEEGAYRLRAICRGRASYRARDRAGEGARRDCRYHSARVPGAPEYMLAAYSAPLVRAERKRDSARCSARVALRRDDRRRFGREERAPDLPEGREDYGRGRI